MIEFYDHHPIRTCAIVKSRVSGVMPFGYFFCACGHFCLWPQSAGECCLCNGRYNKCNLCDPHEKERA